MKKNRITIVLLSLTFGLIQAQQKKWTLHECVEYALENNITIKQAELDLESIELDKIDALGNFLPSLNGRASLTESIGLGTNPTTGVLENQAVMSVSPGLFSSVTLFDGLRNLNRLNRAKLSAIANQYRLDDIKDDIRLFVANAYLRVVSDRESLKVQQAQYESTKQDLQRTKELVDAGIVPEGDLFEIEATAATQEQSIVNAENTLRISKISLAQLLLITDYESFDISEEDYLVPASTIFDVSPKGVYEKALTFRNDIKLSQSNVELAEKDVKISKGASYPTLSAFMNYNTRWADNINLGFVEQFWTFDGMSYGLQLDIPIFNGFANKNAIKRSQINLERSKLQLQQDKLDLEATVNQAYTDAIGAAKTYEAAQKTLKARKTAFGYSQERFNVGLLNSFDFNQSKQAVVQAEAQVVRSKYDYIFRLKVLEFYFGIPISQL
ncbi:TolC family protein [Sungkyunkwania multivorans]|uniref:TolC family protein n=1 Tax=Sungkyunkwania multivorans TaxID=1173618 RepID=A0ABW3D464_9FLAO